MGPLLLGIIVLVIKWLLAFPYEIEVALLLAGIALILYGLYLLFRSGGVGRGSWWGRS